MTTLDRAIWSGPLFGHPGGSLSDFWYVPESVEELMPFPLAPHLAGFWLAAVADLLDEFDARVSPSGRFLVGRRGLEKLEESWARMRLRGCVLLWRVESPDDAARRRDPSRIHPLGRRTVLTEEPRLEEVVLEDDPAIVLNVLGRARGLLLLPGTPFDPHFVDPRIVLATDDPRFVRRVRGGDDRVDEEEQ